MEKIVLVLVLGCCFCVAENNNKGGQNSGSTSSSDICCFTTIAQTVGVLGEKVANMADKMTLLETRLPNTDREVLDTTRVAFSAYKRIFSNYGDCYNPTTGIQRGVLLQILHNDQLLVSVWDTRKSEINDMGINAVVIPLKVGDNVYVELQAGRLVFDDGMNYNTFSGFLLFPLSLEFYTLNSF
uniref:C1q domain-containing protein n=1 Tax=Oryzias sinensis TaxID=183150 RepID=A0A8C7YAZ3_9TELE